VGDGRLSGAPAPGTARAESWTGSGIPVGRLGLVALEVGIGLRGSEIEDGDLPRGHT